MERSIHTLVISSAMGLSIVSGTMAFADSPDRIIDTRDRHPSTQGIEYSERSDYRSGDLSGGFYDDKYKRDNWYYDFYESPGLPPEDRRAVTRNANLKPDAVHQAGKIRFVDAARPMGSAEYAERRPSESAFSRYYDDAWYYDQTDTNYSMPRRAARDSRPATDRDQEVISGKVTAVKQVRNRTAGGQNTVVHVKMADGSPMIADLGPTQPLLSLALAQDDLITVSGNREDIGPYSVLMANTVKSGSNRVFTDRESSRYTRDIREVNGRIEQFRDVRIRGTEQMNRTASLKTDDGNLVLVDLGPSTANNVPANAAPGDRMSASGPVATIGNYPVLFADQLSLNNGVPVRVARPQDDLSPTGRRPWEASHGVIKSQPGAIGDGLPRQPQSNSTDGTTR